MSAKRLRDLVRIVHVVGAFLTGFLVYEAPFVEENEPFKLLVRFVVYPVMLGVTGLWMWQQARVRKLLNGGKVLSGRESAGA